MLVLGPNFIVGGLPGVTHEPLRQGAPTGPVTASAHAGDVSRLLTVHGLDEMTGTVASEDCCLRLAESAAVGVLPLKAVWGTTRSTQGRLGNDSTARAETPRFEAARTGIDEATARCSTVTSSPPGWPSRLPSTARPEASTNPETVNCTGLLNVMRPRGV